MNDLERQILGELLAGRTPDEDLVRQFQDQKKHTLKRGRPPRKEHHENIQHWYLIATENFGFTNREARAALCEKYSRTDDRELKRLISPKSRKKPRDETIETIRLTYRVVKSGNWIGMTLLGMQTNYGIMREKIRPQGGRKLRAGVDFFLSVFEPHEFSKRGTVRPIQK
jgi:hypothetical protein